MITIFIVDDDLSHLYITTGEKYSEILRELHIEPERVTFWTVPFEVFTMIWDGKLNYVMRQH